MENVLHEPETIMLSLLPSIAWTQRETLPLVSAVYFVISDQDVVLYGGQTKNLYIRWKQHHRAAVLESMASKSIAYYVCDLTMLDRVEQAMIQQFQPQLNGQWLPRPPQQGSSPRMCSSAPVQLRYKLTEAAKLVGISHWTLRRMVHDGKVPFLKTESGCFYIPVAWIQAQLTFRKES